MENRRIQARKELRERWNIAAIKKENDSRGDKERKSIPEKFMPVSYRNVKKE